MAQADRLKLIVDNELTASVEIIRMLRETANQIEQGDLSPTVAALILQDNEGNFNRVAFGTLMMEIALFHVGAHLAKEELMDG